MSSGLVYLRPTRLVYLRLVGPYNAIIPEAWSKLYAWHAKCATGAPVGRAYGLARDNPNRVGADSCRYDACIESTPLIDERALRELGLITLPGGPYARTRHVASYDVVRSSAASYNGGLAAPGGLKIDDRRPVVTIYLDDPRRADDARSRADVCVPVSAARVNREGSQAAA